METEIISKELLSEVLGHTFNDSSLEGNQLYCYFKEAPKRGTFCMSDYVLDGIKEGYTGTKVNVYELVHKCKEWAILNHREDLDNLDEDFFYLNDISSSFIGYTYVWQCSVGYWGLNGDNEYSALNRVFTADTEPEAVFKACQWVLRKVAENDN